MKLELGFGQGTQPLEIPDRNVMGVLEPNAVPAGLTGTAEVVRALAEPIGAPPLRQVVRPGETVAIVTSDITRPCPTAKILPPVLAELAAGGIRREDITLVFALGSHRPHTQEEMRRLAGPDYDTLRCVDSVGDFVRLGETRRGTPVDIVRTVAEADRRICLGNIEYHYFAGYSGGAKAIMPGVSTRAAIQANHTMMVLPEACAGHLEGNPLREDIEEAAAICGVDYLVNVVLDALFVLVFHWGVWGAAFATGLAQVTSTAVFSGYFLTHRQRLRFQPFRWELSAYRRILPLGLSEGLNELSNGLVIFLFNHIILRVIGESGLTPYTIISYVNTLVLMTMTCFGQGIQPLVSVHFGAKERSVYHRLLRYGVTLALALSVLFFLLVEVGDRAIVGFFLDRESSMFDYSTSALGLYAFSFLPMGLNVVVAAFFTAMERPVFALSISFGRSLVLMSASLLTLSTLFGDTGIWLSTLCSELLCLILTTACSLRYRRSLER